VFQIRILRKQILVSSSVEMDKSHRISEKILLILAFDVYGSVHFGNLYVRLRVQLDVHGFMCILPSHTSPNLTVLKV
jgi:hypothetical protein